MWLANCIHLVKYSFKIMSPVFDSWAIMISSLHFLKFGPFILQAFSLPCPAPDSPCAISAAACPSGELANSTICASCQVAADQTRWFQLLSYFHIKPKSSTNNKQECAREEGGACEWSEETRGAGQCARWCNHHHLWRLPNYHPGSPHTYHHHYHHCHHDCYHDCYHDKIQWPRVSRRGVHCWPDCLAWLLLSAWSLQRFWKHIWKQTKCQERIKQTKDCIAWLLLITRNRFSTQTKKKNIFDN